MLPFHSKSNNDVHESVRSVLSLLPLFTMMIILATSASSPTVSSTSSWSLSSAHVQNCSPLLSLCYDASTGSLRHVPAPLPFVDASMVVAVDNTWYGGPLGANGGWTFLDSRSLYVPAPLPLPVPAPRPVVAAPVAYAAADDETVWERVVLVTLSGVCRGVHQFLVVRDHIGGVVAVLDHYLLFLFSWTIRLLVWYLEFKWIWFLVIFHFLSIWTLATLMILCVKDAIDILIGCGLATIDRIKCRIVCFYNRIVCFYNRIVGETEQQINNRIVCV